MEGSTCDPHRTTAQHTTAQHITSQHRAARTTPSSTKPHRTVHFKPAPTTAHEPNPQHNTGGVGAKLPRRPFTHMSPSSAAEMLLNGKMAPYTSMQ